MEPLQVREDEMKWIPWLRWPRFKRFRSLLGTAKLLGQADAQDFLITLGLVLIGVGLWLFHPGAGLTAVGALIFLIGIKYIKVD